MESTEESNNHCFLVGGHQATGHTFCELFLPDEYPSAYNIKVPYIMSFSLFMICAGLTLPRTSGELLLMFRDVKL